MNLIIVKAEWDPEASVWVATSEDIRGLAAEAARFEDLRAKLVPIIEDLIEENGLDSDLAEIPLCIVAHQMGKVQNLRAA